MIVSRYMLREILAVFAAVLFILVLIYVSNRFARYLTQAAAGVLSGGRIAELLALKLLENMVLIFPLALFIAILLGLGRLYRDGEITAMHAGGIGTGRIARSVFWLGATFTAISFAFTLYISPRAAALQAQAQDRARSEARMTGILPGRFQRVGAGFVFYIEDREGGQGDMENVFVHYEQDVDGHVFVAESAREIQRGPERDRYMLLENGYRYSGTPGADNFSITKFEEHAVLIDLPAVGGRARKLEAVPTVELFANDDPAHSAELNWRFALPVSVLMLSMLAVALSRTSSRQGRYAKLLVAVLIYFIYSNALGIARHFVESQVLPPSVGIWPVHGVMLLFVFALFLISGGAHRRLLGRALDRR